MNGGYNLQAGGTNGYTVSDETRRRMSEAQLGKVLTEETRKKMSKTRKGKKHSEEHKRNISIAKMGHKHSEETIRKMVLNRNSGKKVNQLDLKGNFIRTWNSMKEAAAGVGLNCPSTISGTCRGKQKTSGGFRWEYYKLK